MAVKNYFVSFRNSTTGGTRVTGLTPTLTTFLNASSLASVSPPSITEIAGIGVYWFAYDVVATGVEIVWQMDGGVSLTQGFDRYIDGSCLFSDQISPADQTNIANTIGARQIVETAATLHSAPTNDQALAEIRAMLAENSVSGQTLTTHKSDGSTVLRTYQLNSPSNPTAINTAS